MWGAVVAWAAVTAAVGAALRRCPRCVRPHQLQQDGGVSPVAAGSVNAGEAGVAETVARRSSRLRSTAPRDDTEVDGPPSGA